MGRRARRVIGVVASIAVPFLAPVIATAIGASAALGKIAGSALVGAGLGAATSAVAGGNIGRGALLGAAGGGLAGFMTPAAGAAAAPATGGTSMFGLPPAATGAVAFDPMAAGFGTPAWAAPGIAPPVAPSVVFQPGGLPGLFSPPPVAPSSVVFQPGWTGFGPSPQTFGTAAPPVQLPAEPGVPRPGAQGAPRTFADALRAIPGTIADRFSDPKVLADMTLRAGATLLTGQVAGTGLSEQEQTLLDAQVNELQTLRSTNEELFRIRLEEAMGLLGEARYFDPHQFGLRAHAGAQIAAAHQIRDVEREAMLRPGQAGLSPHDMRRMQLGAAAQGQQAYLGAAETAQRNRIGVQQVGLAQLPQTGPLAALTHTTGLQAGLGAAEQRRRQTARDVGWWLGSVTGPDRARQTQEDELRRFGPL